MKLKIFAIIMFAWLSGNCLFADYGMVIPRFEIRNHDTTPIAIMLWQLNTMQPEYVVINNHELPGKQGSRLATYTNYDIDPTVPGYILQVQYNDKGKPRRAIYKLKPSQKFYLAWENGALRPQKGTGIFSKKTQSGFDLSNNVSQAGIQKVQ